MSLPRSRTKIVGLALAVVLAAGSAVLSGHANTVEVPSGRAMTSVDATAAEANEMVLDQPQRISTEEEPSSPPVIGEATGSPATIAGWLHTDGAQIRTSDNSGYVIRAVSWFGMETSNCAPHGLWSIKLEAGLAQIKSMGFNTIRLPFSNECLASPTTNSIDYTLNPALQGLSALAVMDAVVASAKATGLSVILDRHRPDSAAQSELWYTSQYSEARWISDWQALATRYVAEPAVIGFDLHNEPHGAACWGCGTTATDWRAAATRAGNAVLAANPNLLIVIEGVERQPNGSSTWWGGGLSGVAAAPVTLDVAGRVVYSPHDYPASIYQQTWFSAAGYPGNLPAVWDANWGYIAKTGIAPVLLGEFGTTLQTTSDQQWLDSMVHYLDTTGISFAFWSFNPNSGDTGGLVQDDWTTPQANKLAALAPLLTPTPVAPAPIVPAPTPASTPFPSTPVTTPSPVLSTTPSTPDIPQTTAPVGPVSVQATWTLQNSWGEGYVADIDVGSASGASSWTVTWSDPAATGVVNSWGASCVISSPGTITCTGVDWASSLSPGQTHKVGLQVEATRAPVSPTLTVTAK
jgi:endoglucanase